MNSAIAPGALVAKNCSRICVRCAHWRSARAFVNAANWLYPASPNLLQEYCDAPDDDGNPLTFPGDAHLTPPSPTDPPHRPATAAAAHHPDDDTLAAPTTPLPRGY
jgi:hypothetical protein